MTATRGSLPNSEQNLVMHESQFYDGEASIAPIESC